MEVVRMLADERLHTTLDFARQLKGRPYVAHTLERGKEHLVVNLRGLDCATLVETASALYLARTRMERAKRKPGQNTLWTTTQETQQKAANDPWRLFCNALESLRYREGRCTDYLSRLHYLTFWIADHLQRGTAKEVAVAQKLLKTRTTDIHFMSRHSDKYEGLKSKEDIKRIAEQESQFLGEEFCYIPQEKCGLSKKDLGNILDGDLVFIVTSIDGLDYSHQGIATWGKDGKLHLLHASSAKKKVIEDDRPLDQYLKGIKTSLGIRVFRINPSPRPVRM